MNTALAYQEEHVQDYEPGLLGWKKASYIGAGGIVSQIIPSALDKWKRSVVIRYPLWRFSAQLAEDAQPTTLRSKRAVEVEIKKGEDLVFAENERLSIFAVGNNEHEALVEFNIQLICQFDHYQRTPERQLIGDAVQIKEIFMKTFDQE